MEKSLNSDPRAAHISGWLSDDEYLALNRENRTLNPYLGDFAHSGSTDLQLFVDTKGDRRFSKRAAPKWECVDVLDGDEDEDEDTPLPRDGGQAKK
jgi:hypothetical protein